MVGVVEQAARGSALARELGERAEVLRMLTRRVQSESANPPRIDARGWSGPASWACDLSLRMLARELDAAAELLRCAADLTAAAAWEAQADA